MFICIICRFAHPLDDVSLRKADGERCICLGCFTRETASVMPMPKSLRRQLSAIVNHVDVAA
jgi:S-adenosylmethionine synthetase